MSKILEINKIITPKFRSFWTQSDKHLYSILKGGRASGKSTSVAVKVIVDMLKNRVNSLCVRKVANTLKNSMFEQIKEALCMLNIDHHWVDTVSPLSLKYKATGQEIIFRGADKPEKIKSIKTSKFPIAILWIEELAEFKTEEEIKIITDSIIRANLGNEANYRIYCSYNPPKLKSSLVNRLYNDCIPPKNTFIHHSTSFDNPHLSDDFLEEAKNYKKTKELFYRWNYLGEAVGGGTVPFSNLTIREITEDEIWRFDTILQGIDWGFAINPFHFTRLHFSELEWKLYIFGEINRLKTVEYQAAQLIKNKGWDDTIVVADSESPMSIQNIVNCKINCIGARKGPGSVEHGLEWLDSLTEIVIDPKRCPKTAQAFQNAEYKINLQGETLPELVRNNIDPIDAVRYAVEDKQKLRKDFYGDGRLVNSRYSNVGNIPIKF